MNKIKVLLYLSVLILALFLLSELCIAFFFPLYSSAARYIIPLFYWGLYSVAIILVKFPFSGKSAPKYIMAFKAAKIFLSLMLLAMLAFVFRSQAMAVIINFLIFSMATLMIETIAMLYMKNRRVN